MPMFRKQMIVVLVIALGAIVGTIYGSIDGGEVVRLDEGTVRSKTLDVGVSDRSDQSAREDGSERTERSESSGERIFVYVTGAVNKPGMVELVGSEIRAADAINACEGLLPTADVDNFNMAELVSDGQHLRVPEKVLVNPGGSSGSGAAPITSAKDGLVDINRAGVEELDTLPGIGPSMAQRIIDYRELNGGFKSIEEIQNVSGIGSKKFENLRTRIKI